MMEISVFIDRWYHDDCTIGRLTFGDFQCFTLELPDLNNMVDVSCIPHGRYKCVKYFSSTHGDCIAILDVDGRTLIRIHAGNFTRQILGCILVGDGIKDIDGDKTPDVTNSKATLKRLLAALPDKFELVIS